MKMNGKIIISILILILGLIIQVILLIINPIQDPKEVLGHPPNYQTEYKNIVIVNTYNGEALSFANEAVLDERHDRIIVTNPLSGRNAGTFGMCGVYIVSWEDYHLKK